MFQARLLHPDDKWPASDLPWQPFYTVTQFINVLKIPTFKQQRSSRGVKVGKQRGHMSHTANTWNKKGFLDTHPEPLLCAAAKQVLSLGALVFYAPVWLEKQSHTVSLKSVQKPFPEWRLKSRLCQEDQCQADLEQHGHTSRLTLLSEGICTISVGIIW